MKALTIEELKSLEVGDWVWVVYSKKGESCYEKIAGIDKTRVLFYGNDLSTTFSTYGTKWLAYKNKEQTETKGEIVEVVAQHKSLDEIERLIQHGRLQAFIKGGNLAEWLSCFWQQMAILEAQRCRQKIAKKNLRKIFSSNVKTCKSVIVIVLQ